MKNKFLQIILTILSLILLGMFFYFGTFIYLLLMLFISNIDSLIEIKTHKEFKTLFLVNIFLFLIILMITYIIPNFSIYLVSIFVIFTSYVFYRHFKLT
jgi:hypothetical protein